MNKDDNLTVYLSTVWMYRKLKGFFPICTLFIISPSFYLIGIFLLTRPMSNSISNASVKFSISCTIFMEIIWESCFLLFFSISKIGYLFMNMSKCLVKSKIKFNFFSKAISSLYLSSVTRSIVSAVEKWRFHFLREKWYFVGQNRGLKPRKLGFITKDVSNI